MVAVEDVVTRLAQLNYFPKDDEEEQIEFELNKITNYTLNYCNIITIPAVVEPRLIDRVCGEFLSYKKNSGTLEGFDYDRVVKSIKEGDTTLTYATGEEGNTPESRFDLMLKSLERGYDKWITPHRKMRW